jgi:hypothetical protein
MNDSLRTDIFLRFTAETIACACIDLAARTLQISLPKNPPWFIIFGARQEEINYIMISILRLYKHRPKSLDELEKLVNIIREKREDERKKLRPELIPQIELGNDSPSQQITDNSISSTVIQQDALTAIATTTTQEITHVITTTNGKILKKNDRGNSRELSTVNSHRYHRSRRRRSGTRSRSSSIRSQKKKKTSYRSRSRSRSSTPKKRKHQKDKRHRSRSSNRRKKEKKRRSSSSSPHEKHYSSTNKHPLSTKDTNHNLHHHHSSKHSNGISSSHKKLKN